MSSRLIHDSNIVLIAVYIVKYKRVVGAYKRRKKVFFKLYFFEIIGEANTRLKKCILSGLYLKYKRVVGAYKGREKFILSLDTIEL